MLQIGSNPRGSLRGKPGSSDIAANRESTKDGGYAESLHSVLGHSERVTALVEECAKDLSSVNGALSQALITYGAPLGLVSVLGQSAALAAKVHAVSAALSVVNRALGAEIRDRSLVDLRAAAAEEQGRAGRHAALHDALTGLPNRALFDDRLEHALAQARRHDWNLVVLFVDLDDFKVINDTYGHDVGDTVLRAIARRLKNATRGEDTVSRHGGDEFLCVLSQVRDEASIAMVAAKVAQAVQAPCAIRIRDGQTRVSVRASIGVAIFPKDGTTADALVKSADAAMDRAKQAKSGV
jgi:diguanylate cyclase (GGDEF)-like protein